MVETKQWKEVKGPLFISLGITALVWLLLFVVVILDPTGHHAGSKQLDLPASSTQTLPVSPFPLITLAPSHSCCMPCAVLIIQ